LKELKEKLGAQSISSSAVFRILIGILIPENEVCSGRDVTGTTIYNNYNDQVSASIGNFLFYV
jgi:hypothetical protein